MPIGAVAISAGKRCSVALLGACTFDSWWTVTSEGLDAPDRVWWPVESGKHPATCGSHRIPRLR